MLRPLYYGALTTYCVELAHHFTMTKSTHTSPTVPSCWMYPPFCHDLQHIIHKMLIVKGGRLPECTECFNLGLRALYMVSNCPIGKNLSMINYSTISVLFAMFLAALWSAFISVFSYCLHFGF